MINKDTNLLTQLNTTSNLLEDTYQTVREMAHAENETKVKQSLVHVIKSLALDVTDSKKLTIEVIDFGLDRSINTKIEILAIRIIQELITNIIKYSKAKNVSIDLTIFEDVLGIIVSDDGVGFDISKQLGNGIGIKSITKKIIEQSGSINIDSSVGNGTTVLIEIPIKLKNI